MKKKTISYLLLYLLLIIVFNSCSFHIKKEKIEESDAIEKQKYSKKHQFTEKEYQTKWCNEKGGITEYVLNDKARVDCLLPKMAVEFDFAQKWAECIGQALYYGKKTNRNPTCVLIMENKKQDKKYLNRLLYTVKNISNFKIFTVSTDLLLNN